ncbi:uncharacterized protein BDZ99DRAFT_459353 [Mytilinidion resinicola]|uniref:Uncharacterized protein n=1 Tax=Mytilinidion resinicola TaxID=574789 RepID=A0A6A6Z5D5_9PEZI|nr:uncharacterized protein BDZ99DRAFT_459353 [Mytilinidion resinicola]KAF2815504.1 hypothetical protein BDZ99DRAFT_459353 [Mytilinidion resinicola]
MKAEAAIFTANENAEKKRIGARNKLEEAALEIRHHELLSHPSGSVVTQMRRIVDEVLEWLEETEHADIFEYQSKHSDFERVVASFIKKMDNKRGTS